MQYLTDTIVAPATPQGQSALAVIRLSGSNSVHIVNAFFRGADLNEMPTHTVHYGWITDQNIDVDEVMVTVFRAPRTFTMEDSVEISCHGSPVIVQQILSVLVAGGARMANPGEFTLRAFLHGRLDLSQAEAVADIIHATSGRSADIALKQLKGHFSGQLKELRQELIDFAALMELELDFSEEDVEFANRGRLQELIERIVGVIDPMMASFQWGNSIREGIPVAIIGAPNAGKSTLLNALLSEEKAMVSEIAGTTRDYIEDTLVIQGVTFRFTDTAGIRETKDVLEGMGIERSRQKLREADIVFFVCDASKTGASILEEYNLLLGVSSQEIVVLLNKSDQLGEEEAVNKSTQLAGATGKPVLAISARDTQTLTGLWSFLEGYILSHNQAEGTVISNVRHFEALARTKECLNQVSHGLSARISSDLVAMDLREGLYHLGTITGQVTTDDLLESIFSRFCIGK
jgi:tRNA modification GTPase